MGAHQRETGLKGRFLDGLNTVYYVNIDFFYKVCYNSLVVFAHGKREGCFSMQARIVSFSEAKDKLFEVASKWAINEQKRNGFIATPINFIFDRDELTYDQKKVYISVFFNNETGDAIMRRDWDDSFTVQYNILANYDQIAKIAPHSLAKLKNNGIELYKRYRRAGF